MADRLDVILSKLYRGTIRPDMARHLRKATGRMESVVAIDSGAALW